MLRTGAMSLSTVCLVSRVIDRHNARDLLARVAGKAQPQVAQIVAEFGVPAGPKRDCIRPVRAASRSLATAQANRDGVEMAVHSGPVAAPGIPIAGTATDTRTPTPTPTLAGSEVDLEVRCNTPGGAQPDASEPKATWSTELAFDVSFRGDAVLMEKFERVRTLVARSKPGVSIAEVLENALEAYLHLNDPSRREQRRVARQETRRERRNLQKREQPKLEQDVQAERVGGSTTARPSRAARASLPSVDSNVHLDSPPTGAHALTSLGSGSARPETRGTVPGPSHSARNRYIPRSTRDQVFNRDGLRCTYVGPDGRCPQIRGLHLDHIVPYSRGGSNQASNLRVRCATHNQLEAERVFGKGFMKRRRRASGGRRT